MNRFISVISLKIMISQNIDFVKKKSYVLEIHFEDVKENWLWSKPKKHSLKSYFCLVNAIR